ncbi:MAG: bifunctional phosphopantothenoylcysteine decarboxylase/phosphopantothenate--cysteine ligase CoaBC [Desulfovibrionaceae bacterium]|nr:bifunctional phosphopantothenoylcysteine decarboxylase/phosphopantothenate--cysteine ligase CoaBC [Desulfovibrionaceae bacterium]
MDAIQLLRGLTRLKNRRLHLGVAGSVACYRSAELLRHLLACGIHVSATLTPGAKNFVTPLLFSSLGAVPVYPEMFSGEEPFAHLEPGQTCQALLVCPASAGLLARMAHGLAQDMLAAQILAFDGPVAAAPAMNTRMWNNAATRDNVALLKSRGVTIVEPDSGLMACGTSGEGRLADMPQLLAHALRLLCEQDMAGQTVLVTLGPTREPWDGVRFWSNPSTGTMGAALALCAWLRGATVHAVAGPGIGSALVPALPGLTLHQVTTARQMFARASELWDTASMGMFSAAVADFSPRPYGAEKFKKEGTDTFRVDFEANPDILRTLSEKKRPGQRLLGFAAETAPDMESLMALARKKLRRKDVHVLAANRVNAAGSGFGSATNAMAVAGRDGREEFWPEMGKADVAWDLCSWLLHS